MRGSTNQLRSLVLGGGDDDDLPLLLGGGERAVRVRTQCLQLQQAQLHTAVRHVDAALDAALLKSKIITITV